MYELKKEATRHKKHTKNYCSKILTMQDSVEMTHLALFCDSACKSAEAISQLCGKKIRLARN